jgi:hypothetical protein
MLRNLPSDGDKLAMHGTQRNLGEASFGSELRARMVNERRATTTDFAERSGWERLLQGNGGKQIHGPERVMSVIEMFQQLSQRNCCWLIEPGEGVRPPFVTACYSAAESIRE